MSPADERAARSRKGEETREKILETALRLFREKGYTETTMRAVADEAGVALGNAYYYFASKEHLIQAFYARTVDAHVAKVGPIVAKERDFAKRLAAVLHAKVDVDEPYHRFSGVLFRTAADPESPLNPFSAESLPVRRRATDVLAGVVEGSSFRPSKDLAPEIASLLWTFQMGVTLFWIFDRSPSRKRTRELIDTTVPIVARILQLGAMPILRPMTRKGIAFLRRLREDQESLSPAAAAAPAAGRRTSATGGAARTGGAG
jgi:AcrR family transcriptional regulator